MNTVFAIHDIKEYPIIELATLHAFGPLFGNFLVSLLLTPIILVIFTSDITMAGSLTTNAANVIRAKNKNTSFLIK